MALFFKHIYGPEVAQWGTVGFPKTQPAATALGSYSRGDHVLLAVPENEGEEAQRGRVFAKCTFLNVAGPAEKLANPHMMRRMPEVVTRWHTALPVKRYWMLENPIRYRDVSGLAPMAERARGRMIPIDDPEMAERFHRAHWVEVEDVYHAPVVQEILGLLGG